jgi:anti-sigma28 factor (negative regulator of flagellin synthesis)
MASKIKKSATISVSGALPKVKLSMPLDAKKIKAIQKCIAKGTLEVTLSKVDLVAGRLGESWLYD